ncbi:unnamed protein product [Dimorphilus gyrociliatus]|uniref:Uncharacterized protein n=1 Tax=Dimorphilus gyrociliatus TaxID=2664684 RepID=A0A7I8VFL1_9ANNE|nr:unnamed protein product [Dimorphilus gyrociliatus]
MSRLRTAYQFSRRYTGRVKAVILDWSGTTADKYVIAPAVVFAHVFEKAGVPISMSEAREPMGIRKDLHIATICNNPSVRQRWFNAKGRYPNQGDVEEMYKNYIPAQLECLPKYTDLIPGAAKSIKTLRDGYGIKVGSTTGFSRPMVDILVEGARKQGLDFDATVAGDEVINGSRPKPFMIYKNMDLMNVHPIQSVIKVDDTTSGVGEALEAGCWGVGVARYSNYMDINSFEEEENYTREEIEARTEKSKQKLRETGVHYVIDSIAELPAVVEDINERLARGEQP